MEPDEGIGGRIMKIIYHYRLNKNSFSLKVGLDSNSVITRIVNDPTRGISLDLLQKISNTFPDIDLNWLVMGKGNVFKGERMLDPTVSHIKYFKNHNKKPVDMMHVTGYDDCESSFDVIGDSMYPRYRTGDIVICKEIDLSKPLTYGESYLLYYHDNPLIRYIKNSPEAGLLKLGAENNRYEDIIINSSDVENAYIIKGVIRREAY